MPEEITDLFTHSAEVSNPKKNTRIFTVSELTQNIKMLLENAFGCVWVEGEISNFRPHPSGCFFSLKDEKALLNAVIFNKNSKDIKFKIEDGLKVICFGRVEVYAPYGRYQIIIEKLEPKGIGSLQLALEQLKEKLEKEGLFSLEHKRPIPYLPSKIGVVTSGHGAAIKDILKVLDNRFKDVHIIISPVRVQGEEAKEEIAQAIKDFNIFNQTKAKEEQVEVLIVGRGGGSIEDLWAFNEEEVCRAIYNSKIPVISAVGHERDWTIADLTADLRAPTPSAAAEQVIPKKDDLETKLKSLISDIERSFLDITTNLEESFDSLKHRLVLNMLHIHKLNISSFESAVKKLLLLNPADLIPQYKDKIFDLAKQICRRMQQLVKIRELEFTKAVEKMTNLNPLNILSRGYSATFKLPEEEILKDASVLKNGDFIRTRLYKGEIISKVGEVKLRMENHGNTEVRKQ